MYPQRNGHGTAAEVLGFTYPRLHTGAKWYVDFRAYDPATGEMRRKKYHLDNIPKIKERRRRAAELIESLTRHLRSGWSPWVDASSSRSYILFEDALAKYEAYIERMPRYATRKSYSSRMEIMKKYNTSRLLPIKYVYQYDTAFVSDFLDYIYLDREVSAHTRNNYRQWCQALGAFFVEKQYLPTNPAAKIRDLPEAGKKRQPLTREMLRKLEEHLAKKDPIFYLACMMEYYTFIRPEELSWVKVGDISVAKQTVYVRAEHSKNGRDANVAINDKLAKLMIDLGVLTAPSDYYLFSKHVGRPAAKRGGGEMFRRKWNRLVRAGLRWPDCYQFYSLKDSGLRDLANAAGIVIARDQARHTDVATTNKYLQGRDAPVHEEVKHFEGGL